MSISNEKVFYIGFPKTGTKSIGALFRVLGYNVKSYDGKVYKQDLWDYVIRRDLSPFYEIVDKFDAFEDIPWCYVFKDVYKKYPQSKFIYHYREENSWYSSINNMNMKYPVKRNMLDYLYEYEISGGLNDKERRIAVYRYHRNDVLNFFDDKQDQFLQVDLFNDKDVVQKISTFLGKDTKLSELPHYNRGSYSKVVKWFVSSRLFKNFKKMAQLLKV